MTLAPEIITAVIGVLSALAIVVVRDVLLQGSSERRRARQQLLQARIEHAYAPLEFLSYTLFNTDQSDQKVQLRQNIASILCHRGYLLSEESASAFYVLLEDETTGAELLEQHFVPEFTSLKNDYYRLWYTPQTATTAVDRYATPLPIRKQEWFSERIHS